MDMEFRDNAKRRRVLLLVVGAALAAVAGLGAFTMAGGGRGDVPVETESVLVATRDIPARQQVTPDDVVVRQVPVAEALSQSYREANLVLGRLTAVPVYADQQITPNLFATTAADTEFSILGPDEVVTLDSPYWRAVAIEVPSGRAVGGEITAGQHIDLFVSVQIDVLAVDPEGNYQHIDTATEEGLMSGRSTKITFQDIEVLKADADEGTYILKVDLKQAEEISHIVQVAPDSFTMALRPDIDTRAIDTSEYGETTDRLVMTYLYPVPQLIDLSQLLGFPVTPTAPAPDPDASPGPDGSPAPDASPGPEESPAPSPSL